MANSVEQGEYEEGAEEVVGGIFWDENVWPVTLGCIDAVVAKKPASQAILAAALPRLPVSPVSLHNRFGALQEDRGFLQHGGAAVGGRPRAMPVRQDPAQDVIKRNEKKF
jgi:hypothetical protein